MSEQEENKPDLAQGVPLDALADGRLLSGTFHGEDVIVVDHDGRRCAFAGKCTHLDAPLAEGLVVDGEIRCPWHHARFSLATGEAVGAPAFEPLASYAVEERDGRVFVTGKRDAVAPRTSTARTLPERVVVVGSGAAGHACAEMLTRGGFGGRVTVVGGETERPYDRTFCSKQYLAGKAERTDCFLPDLPAHGDGAPTWRLGCRATAIDVQRREVELDDGERLGYDALVLATGCEPSRPPIAGFDRNDVFLLRSLADADALIAAAQAGKRAIVVGASFIGLEVAASLTQRKLSVEVVAPDEIPLAHIVGDEVGAMIRKVHEEKGVTFHLGQEASAWDGSALTLGDGSVLDGDLLILATGVTPRVALAEAAGIEVASEESGGGVVVDERLASSIAGIYAIGDIARYPDRHVGKPIRVEHWVHAQRQGQFVARHLMGLAERFDDLPFFWSAHFDTGLRYLGHVANIESSRVDGSIEQRDFTIQYAGQEKEKAFASCNHDLAALEMESRWEATAGDRRSTG